jgi:beta-aspartyl-peptidase (threonine type)
MLRTFTWRPPMLRRALIAIAALAGTAALAEAQPTALVIHGGAGTISRETLSAEREAEIRRDLERALEAGHAVLRDGGSAIDAVSAAVVVMEDSPHFNAGRGAVFNAEGVNELDAAIMDGARQRAGSVAAVHRVKNPVLLARAVMERSAHVMLIGDGAETFGRGAGIEFVEPAYFRTEHRWQQLQDARAREATRSALPRHFAYGTVGAVALDASGHIAAATSTGGMTNKRWGRVGDAPIIGAGTWADPNCGVSATGWGEYFIRLNVAHDICARLAYRGDSLEEAAREVVMRRVPALGGDGGIIALDANGDIALEFNTEGMYRGWVGPDGRHELRIYRD